MPRLQEEKDWQKDTLTSQEVFSAVTYMYAVHTKCIGAQLWEQLITSSSLKKKKKKRHFIEKQTFKFYIERY